MAVFFYVHTRHNNEKMILKAIWDAITSIKFALTIPTYGSHCWKFSICGFAACNHSDLIFLVIFFVVVSPLFLCKPQIADICIERNFVRDFICRWLEFAKRKRNSIACSYHIGYVTTNFSVFFFFLFTLLELHVLLQIKRLLHNFLIHFCNVKWPHNFVGVVVAVILLFFFFLCMFNYSPSFHMAHSRSEIACNEMSK